MRTLLSSLVILLSALIMAGCGGKTGKGKGSVSEADNVSVPDTGYTGIKQYFNKGSLLKEITFENSIRNGLMKTYYQTGQLYQIFWYEKGLREDSAVWYYLEGQPFRTTPYVHDTIHGIQKQYYRTGKIKARIGYKKGLRTTLFEEYDMNERLFTDYPEIVTDIKDEYNKVKFYNGEFTDGRFDTTRCNMLETVNGKASLVLRKSGTPQKGYTGVIAEIVTPFGNRNLIYKKVDMPYNDLK